MYQIARKIDDATEWSIQGNIGKRKFIDSAIPAGSSMVTYRIQAQRTTSQGEPANFTVQLTGAGGGAGMTAKVVDAA